MIGFSNRFCLFLALLTASLNSLAQTVNWSRDVAPIVYKNCTSCHHPGALAPNSLMSYSEAFNYRYLIDQYVKEGVMPPWPPDSKFSRLAHERVISAEDKKLIADWVTAGAPEGNPADAPIPPVYTPSGSQLSGVSYSAKMQDYVVNTSSDLYRCFVINTNFTADKFAGEIEVVPGNTKIVHHVLVFEDTSSVIAQLDSADSGAGYTSFFGTGNDGSQLIGEWVPGTAAIKFPNGMGVKLKKNTRLILQIHYPKGTYLQTDSTRVNIRFTNDPPSLFFREVQLAAVLNENELKNGPLVIAPETVKSFTETYVAPANPQLPFGAYTILSVAPHMHLIGKKIKVYGLENGTNDTIPMIRINDWDFKWQGIYNFRKPMKIVPGTTLVAEAVYDNTSSNVSNPNSPPITVTQGESTTEEMMLVFFAFTYYMPGDENLSIDDSPLVGLEERSAESGYSDFEIYPNPAKGMASLRCFATRDQAAEILIYNLSGKEIIRSNTGIKSGDNEIQLNLKTLTPGSYLVSIQTQSQIKTKPLIVYE